MLFQNWHESRIRNRITAHQNKMPANQTLGVQVSKSVAQTPTALGADHLDGHLNRPGMPFLNAVP